MRYTASGVTHSCVASATSTKNPNAFPARRTVRRRKRIWRFTKTSIELVFLPAYAPNLNLIERFWKFFKKQDLYNRYYDTVDKFKRACTAFFADVRQYRA